MAHNNLSASEDAPARPIDHGRVARSFVVGVLALWRINLEIGYGCSSRFVWNRLEEPLV
jgi:hypothetical protein